MNTLPTKPQLPRGLTVEKPARNLASLAATDDLVALQRVILSQWRGQEEWAKLAKFGIRPVDRLLFYGPPGNGKTMASGWLAHKMDAPLYRVRCEQIVQSLFGATAANVGAIMHWLKSQPKCVVLWDEVEMLFPSRELGSDACDRESASAMGVFWQYLDRWEAPTLFVLATNMRDRLDPALLSRIDMQLEFGPPSPEQAASVAHYWAEILHEYGGGTWGPVLAERGQWESFRELFQSVQWHVRQHVTNRTGESA